MPSSIAGSTISNFLRSLGLKPLLLFISFYGPKMKALAYFTAVVEESPCLALPSKTIRRYIKTDSIVLEGADGEEYRARLFSRSKSSDNMYVAAGWSKFEHAHGIDKGDVLFCKLLPGLKLKIQVAEKNGRQHSDSLTDYSSIGKLYKKRKINEHTCSKKHIVQDSGSDSDSESSISRQVRKSRCNRRVERPRKNQDHYTNKREETPGPCSKKEQLLTKIQVFESKIYNPYHVMELTTTKMKKRGVLPRDFRMHVNAVNGSSVKLLVEGHKKHRVNWISGTFFQGFGKGWVDFLRLHNLKVGDYLVFEIIGAKTIKVHLFYQSANQGKQEGMSSAYCKSEPCTSFKIISEPESQSEFENRP